MLPIDQFKTLVKIAPLVAIDLIMRDSSGQYLLGRRINPPARGWWFVPGGRIYKGESFNDAFWRIVRQELGPKAIFKSTTFHGIYEHFYDDNFLSEEGFGTHYVILAYSCELDVNSELDVSEQHGALRLFSAAEILSSPDVHEFTQAYCQHRPKNSLFQPLPQKKEGL